MIKTIAPAKVNLNLNITGRREDGYHLLDSIMVFTNWGDEITINPASEFRLTADGPFSNIFTTELLATDKGSPNLIVQAAYLMAAKACKNPDIHIHITKHIPAGAGLGGGSSNAAAVMKMLNDYWDLDIPLAQLCEMGLTLGAELPVCLQAQSSRVTGIGDVVKAVVINELNLLIAWPQRSLLTKDVFDKYRAQNLPFSKSEELDADFAGWLQRSNNDLTSAAIELNPNIAEILSNLQSSKGCHIARMTGSGSACFAIFNTKEAATAASVYFENVVVTTTIHNPT